MKKHSGMFLILAIVLSSCSPKKNLKQEQFTLPVNIISIDSFSVGENSIHYTLTIISPLPESLAIVKTDMKHTDGDTALFYLKMLTIVPDSSKPYLGNYRIISPNHYRFGGSKIKILRMQFWRDSASTIDTLIHFK